MHSYKIPPRNNYNLAGSTFEIIPPEDDEDPVLHPPIVAQYSTNSSRGNPVELEGATLDSNVYIFLANNDSDILRVQFYVDPDVDDEQLADWVAAPNDSKGSGDPDNEAFVRGDISFPYDLKGGTVAANVWDTHTDPAKGNRVSFETDGSHVLKVAIIYLDGTTQVESFSFDVDNSVSAPTPPATPTGLSLSTPVNFTIYANWDDNSEGDLAGYDYRIGTTNPPTTAPISVVGSEVTITGLTGGTNYRVQVRAYNTAGQRSGWSSVVSKSATGTGEEEPSTIDSWMVFGPAGDGINPNPNALIYGLTQNSYPTGVGGGSGATAEYQMPCSGSYSNMSKKSTDWAGFVTSEATNPNKPASAVGRWASLTTNGTYRLRKIQHPSNGGFGATLATPTYGGRGTVGCHIASRHHNSKTWIYNNTLKAWKKTDLLKDPQKDMRGYTAGVTGTLTHAEDTVLAMAQLASGLFDSKLVALGYALVDNRNGGVQYGDWVDRLFYRVTWECSGYWSTDYIGIDPNLIGSVTLEKAATGVFSLGLSSSVKTLIGNLIQPGDPYYMTFNPNPALASTPGWRQRGICTHNPLLPCVHDPDAGKGGDRSMLAAAAYIRFFDTVNAAIAERCAFRGVPIRKFIGRPNFSHPGATPESFEDSPGGNDGSIYRPYVCSNEINLRFLDIIGRDRIPCIDVDFYCRSSLRSIAAYDKLATAFENLMNRYKRPFASGECGFSRAGSGACTPSQLGEFLEYWHHPVTGWFATHPVAFVVHFTKGEDLTMRYYLDKAEDNTGTPNPWQLMKTYYPGRGTAPNTFWGS